MNLFDLAPREVADTSLDAYHERVLPTLTEMEIAVFLGLWRYIEQLGHENATGRELGDFLGLEVTTTRPRLNGLERKGWIEKTPARKSRRAKEGTCHGYRPVVPRQAVERLKERQS